METGAGCMTAVARVSFDVETAPHSTCTVLGERSFAILVAPEHAPPINPSPWYAFRYTARGPEPISVRLDYLGARHRYAPKLVRGSGVEAVPAELSTDGRSARLTLPSGEGVIAAQ